MLVKLLKPLSFVPALLLMYMIFSFSAQDGTTSSELSYKVSYKIVEAGDIILDTDLQPSQIDSLATRFNGYVRKLAHMSEYFALAVAVAFPLYVYGLHGLALMFIAGFICVAFACGDEYHQSFVSGRGPSVRDVLIDSFGIFWGIVLVRIIGWTGRKTIFRPFRKRKKRQEESFTAAGQPYPYGRPDQNGQTYANGRPYQSGQQAYTGGQIYTNGQPYRNGQPYTGGQSYTNRPPYPNGQPYPYGQPAPNGYPEQSKRRQKTNSDTLSEDMSLKNLMRNLKEKGKKDENE